MGRSWILNCISCKPGLVRLNQHKHVTVAHREIDTQDVARCVSSAFDGDRLQAIQGRHRALDFLPTWDPIVNQIFPYISVGLDDKNRCIVVVEDYELFDFIDDFLGDECDLPYDYRTTKERLGGEIVTMYFPPDVTPETIERNLLKLSPGEIERIYKLNN